ncbi:MAG TPA: hypothetical protein PLM71_09890 [Syntrophorhabdaceae bacterium]|nr:hypothetical protein [Syntrophorhabdaceae bacterium]
MNIQEDCAEKRIIKIKLCTKKDITPLFFIVLQEGVFVKTQVGQSVRTVLKDIFNINDELIEKRISTILLDGKVVDDIDSVIIKENSSLSISGAMPGLAGATMRRHSKYETFRTAITYIEKKDPYPVKTCCFAIKIFNILLVELAKKLLKQGIILHAYQLRQLFSEKKDRLKDYINYAYINETKVKPSDSWGFMEKYINDDRYLIYLNIKTSGEEEDDC